MVTNRVKQWDKYHKKQRKIGERLFPYIFKEKWVTDSELSYTEEVLSTCQEIKRRGRISTETEDYYKKLLSTAKILSKEAEEKGETENAAKEVIKKYVAHENISFQTNQYNLLDLIDTNKGNCLGKTTLFSCLAEMINYDLFSKLKKVNTP